MSNVIEDGVAPRTKGLVIHWAARYDLLAWLLTRGREGAFRERLIGLAGLEPGNSVLDIGCGTGTLAIAATRHVGPTGAVVGIDASPQMIARATRKAAKAGYRSVGANVGTPPEVPMLLELDPRVHRRRNVDAATLYESPRRCSKTRCGACTATGARSTQGPVPAPDRNSTG
jgi:SAM-dependent methyltransferase